MSAPPAPPLSAEAQRLIRGIVYEFECGDFLDEPPGGRHEESHRDAREAIAKLSDFIADLERRASLREADGARMDWLDERTVYEVVSYDEGIDVVRIELEEPTGNMRAHLGMFDDDAEIPIRGFIDAARSRVPPEA